MLFLWLNNADIAKFRVAKRVAEGGHNIPLDVIHRRYLRGLQNLKGYISIVDAWFVYDNSRGEYELIAKKSGETKEIINFETWQRILP